MKKTLILTLCMLMALSTLCLIGCDLSHKHYNNQIGICKSCNHDSAKPLTNLGQSEYEATTESVLSGNQYFYEITAQSTGNLQVTIDGAGVNFNSVLLYENTTQIGYSFSQSQSVILSRGLEQGKTYRLVIKYNNAGTVQLKAVIID